MNDTPTLLLDRQSLGKSLRIAAIAGILMAVGATSLFIYLGQ